MTLAANRSLTDEALKTIVDVAHAHGTKVLISIGGAGGDKNIMQFQGENTVARETQLGAQYGGAMIWELTQDDPSSPHSLLKVIQKNLDPAAPRIPQPTPRRGGGD